ncbi:multidrug resistance protein [Peptoniphilus indolicus]|uniref:Multidrug resistance protein n=2 Tax=Peptoniphilus indolicus TaxID=33030 RepID=A0A379DE26_9FIRM|nr:multidrug resistance protein [Peptoniphilus indolicus]
MKELKRIVYYTSFSKIFISIFIPVYILSFETNIIHLGGFYSVFNIFGVLFRRIVGKIIDNKGRKSGIFSGIILHIISMAVFIKGYSFINVIIGTVIYSIGESFLLVSFDSLVADLSNEFDISINFGIINETFSKGSITGCLLILPLLFKFSLQDGLKFISIFFILVNLFALYKAKNYFYDTSFLRNKNEMWFKGKIIKKNNFFLYIGVVSFVTSLTSPLYLIYFKENVISEINSLAYLYLPSAIFMIFLPSKLGKFISKANKYDSVFYGILFTSVLYMMISLSNSGIFFISIFTAILMTEVFYTQASSSILIEITEPQKIGIAYGNYRKALGIGKSIGPILGVYLYRFSGGKLSFFIIGFILSIIVFIFYRKYKNNMLLSIRK